MLQKQPATQKQPTPAQLAYWKSKRCLTPQQEDDIRLEYATLRTPYKALAKKYGVSRHKIFMVVNTNSPIELVG